MIVHSCAQPCKKRAFLCINTLLPYNKIRVYLGEGLKIFVILDGRESLGGILRSGANRIRAYPHTPPSGLVVSLNQDCSGGG